MRPFINTSPRSSMNLRGYVSPKRVMVVPEHTFKSQPKWDLVLSTDVKLSQRFESVKRTIYGLGFTCVVVMGINRDSKEV